MGFNADDYLAHHGIKGQKWGVRRFQNSDGSLTAAGKQRYGTGNGASKPNEASTDSSMDHSKSDKSEVAKLAIHAAISLATLNPVGMVYDISRIAQAASASSKDKANQKRMSELEVDPSTGLHLKNKEMTPEEDMSHVNPGYKNLDGNTKNNCMLCTTAYDLRRRGYDVTANRASYGYMTSDINRWYPNAKRETVDGSYRIKPIDKNSPTYKEDRDALRKAMLTAMYGRNKPLAENTISHLKAQGDGARGNLMVQWGNGSGHSMVYEVDNGAVVIRDAQINKTFTKQKQIERILSQCIGATSARLDNVDFDHKRIKEAVS